MGNEEKNSEKNKVHPVPGIIGAEGITGEPRDIADCPSEQYNFYASGDPGLKRMAPKKVFQLIIEAFAAGLLAGWLFGHI